MFVVEITVQPPVVSAFSALAEVSGLRAEVTSQATVVHSIDNAGVRKAIKEIDGVLYSFQGNTVFQTDSSTGATQSRTFTALPGATGMVINDVASVNGELVFVGGSLTGNTAPTKSSIATSWDSLGTPTRIGPAGQTGLANFVTPTGLIGGFYEAVSSEYTPWLKTPLGDFDLPRADSPTTPQMVTGASATGYYLVGYAGNTPMIWQANAAPESGDFELILSPELPMEYPANATLTAAGRNYRVLEDSLGVISIFGQYELPIINQGQNVGSETHTGMWSLTGAHLFDFGANTEMLGVQTVGSTYFVAHRNSVTIIDQLNASVVTLNDLLGNVPPVGSTRRILDSGLLITGSPDEPVLALNFAEVTSAVTRNRIALKTLKRPDQVEIDIQNDGIWDDTFFDFQMASPTFEPIGYGQRTLAARVTYSDGSTANAVTTYQSLPFEAISSGIDNQLLIGGTEGADVATLTQLTATSYRASIAGQTRDFTDIDSVLIDLATGSDRLVLSGGLAINLQNLEGVETIDAVGESAEIITGVEPDAVALQVGPTGTLLIKVDLTDTFDLFGDWKLQKPQSLDGRATLRLTSEDKTLLVQSGSYTNPINNLDTSFDSFVTALDALLIINHINQAAGGTAPTVEAYLDVNNNGSITALDVLLIINYINSGGAAEGEFVPAAVDKVLDIEQVTDLDWVGAGQRRRPG